MRAFKIYFLGRLLREKLMLVMLVVIAVCWWGSAFAKRSATAWQAHRALTTRLAEQKRWLQSRTAIEAAAQQAIKNLDPAQTLDETKLVGELITIARDLKVTLSNDAPRTDRSGQFAVHTVQINLARIEWSVLNSFYYAVAARSPYMGVTQFAINANPSNPKLLNATLQVSSVEIVHQ